MALEDMIKALEEESKQEREEIIDRAKKSAKRILDEAKEEAKRLKQEEVSRVTAGLEGEQAKLLNTARLSVKKDVIKAKEEVIQEVFKEVETRLEKLRESADYQKIFETLTREALEGIKGKVKIEVDKKDLSIAKTVLEKQGLDFTLEPSPTSMMGLQVTTEDGRITVTNTFDSRLDKARQFLKSELTSVLFG